MSKFVLPYTGMGKIWKCSPHLTVDNFFNGDSILDWMGERRLGMIETVARNKLPKGKCLPKQSLGSSLKPIAEFIAAFRVQVLVIWVLSTANPQTVFSSTGKKKEGAMIKANIGYKSWKYYHSAVNQPKALSIATAYDAYKELTDDTHGPTWSIEKSMDYCVFMQKLAEQMLHYDPKNQLYPAGVSLLHENTQMSKC
eukprot:jgi/Psemu1/40743/gm1.40743_g